MTPTNATTAAIIKHLNFHGFRAWRNPSGAVYSVKRQAFMRNPAKLNGTFDIIGFCKRTGRHIEVEVKTGKDKMSADQERHYEELYSSGCIVIVAKGYDDFEKQFREHSQKISNLAG